MNPLLDIATRAREDRARGRVLHLAQALPERRLLLGPDLRGARPAGRDVPGDVRDRAHERLDRAVARDGARQGAEDRPPAPDLHGRAHARLRADRAARAGRGALGRAARRDAARTHRRTARRGRSVGVHGPRASWTDRRSSSGRSRRSDKALLAGRARAALARVGPPALPRAQAALHRGELRYLTEVDFRRPLRARRGARATTRRARRRRRAGCATRDDPARPRWRSSSPTTSRARASDARSAARSPTPRASAASRRFTATMLPENVAAHRLLRRMSRAASRSEPQGTVSEATLELVACGRAA